MNRTFRLRLPATLGALVLVLALGTAWIAVAAQAPSPARARQPFVEVHKDPGCGCCSLWVQHLRRSGFDATAQDDPDMAAFKDARGVPKTTRSCHTGIVGGYVIEGHVPAADIHRLLKEKPADVIGLAVPGMPIGSPGMEGPGSKPYEVLALHKGGRTSVFSTQRP